MSDTLILSEQLSAVHNTETAALRSVIQGLVAENQRLREHIASVTTANAAAAALIVELREAQALLQMQNAQLELHNRFIRHTFGRYLNNDVVARLLDSPMGLALGGERRKVTLLMSDLRGFTTLSERLRPEEVVTILNRYLGAMADIILRYHGTIDEFIGDAILVIFGAPMQRDDDAYRAVACAVEMQRAMVVVNAHNRREGLPEVEMGIGVHTGEVVVGNIGSDKRAKYGVVGRHVNLTSRIESCTVGSQILVSEATRREVGSLIAIAEQIQVMAKGIETPMTLYDVRGVGGSDNLTLPHTEEPLLPLPMALPLWYTVIEDKRPGAVTLDGSLVKIAHKGGEIRSEHTVAPFSDIKMQLTDGNGHPVLGSLYGKVLPYSPQHGPGFPVRFTAIAPEAASFLQGLIASCRPNSIGHPVGDHAGEVVQCIDTTIDLTDRKQSEKKRQRAQADLVHATRVMTPGEMTASIAHAINQPLAAVTLTANACLRWFSSAWRVGYKSTPSCHLSQHPS
jgi:class 3 adenylate cyclase